VLSFIHEFSAGISRIDAVCTGALMANKLRAICDFLFFGGPMPADKDVKNLLNEDNLLI
jgi:hypothetical protein